MKRYLTGIDWVINSLDFLSRKETGIGNNSQVVVEINGVLCEQDIRKRLEALAEEFPVLFGYPQRAFNLCPYWSIDPKKKDILRLDVHRLGPAAGFNNAMQIFAQASNSPFKCKREHLFFTLVFCGDKSFLGMVFDHRVMGARGAEAFLEFLSKGASDGLHSSLCYPANLNKWINKFRAGRKVNRFYLHLIKDKTRTLSRTHDVGCFSFDCFRFDQKRSLKISEDAFERAGYLMFLPYILSKSVLILHEIFKDKGVSGDDYFIPVSIDTRHPDLVRKELFFNHLSFFLFRISSKDAGDFNKTLSSIKDQMYSQVKEQLPQAISEASFLMRIAPLPLVSFLLKIMSKGNQVSFPFAFIAEGTYSSDNFMGFPVANILHLPRLPFPVRLGIFFNQYQGRFNATVSYIQGSIDNKDLEKIRTGLNALG